MIKAIIKSFLQGQGEPLLQIVEKLILVFTWQPIIFCKSPTLMGKTQSFVAKIWYSEPTFHRIVMHLHFCGYLEQSSNSTLHLST